jgi:hypothetical protein
MIKGLTGTSGVTISGGFTALPYITPNANNPIQGMIRINNSELEVFNGTSWQILNTSYATVSLDPDAQAILEWARKKRDEEIEIDLLSAANPTIKNLLEQIKEKEDQLQMVMTLIKSPGNEPIELMGS